MWGTYASDKDVIRCLGDPTAGAGGSDIFADELAGRPFASHAHALPQARGLPGAMQWNVVWRGQREPGVLKTSKASHLLVLACCSR